MRVYKKITCHSNAHLNLISDPPHQPTVTGFPAGSELNTGETLSLTCIPATTGGTPTSLELYRGTEKLTTTATGVNSRKYEVTSVTSTHAGAYKCKAINSDGNAVSTPQTLNVKGKYM